MPWAFKWVWAPLIDLVKLNKYGGRKAWIVFCTCMMIVTLLVTAAVDFVENFQLLMVMIVLNNIFGATQDVAIDSLAVSTLKEEERARGNGFMFGGQYLGIALGGGGAIFVYGAWGFNVALVAISLLLLCNLVFIILFVQDPDATNSEEDKTDFVLSDLLNSLSAFMREFYKSFFKSGNGPKLGLLFSLLPVGSMALAYAILGTIQVDYGLSQNQIAGISVYNTISAAIGCILGGALADKYGQKKMMGIYYILTAVPTLILAIQISKVGLTAIPIELLYIVIIGHGFVFGMTFGVHAAIFMGMTNPAIAATQFTAFMAMTNLAISFANFWQGIIAERVGYAMVLYLDVLFVLVPLAIIPFLRSREEERRSKQKELASSNLEFRID